MWNQPKKAKYALLTKRAPFLVGPSTSFSMPIASNWGTPEAFSLSTMKHSHFCTWPSVIDKTQVTQADSFAIANSEKIAFAFLIWLVFIYLQRQYQVSLILLLILMATSWNFFFFFFAIKNTIGGTSLVFQCLRICLPMQGTWVWPLVGELRSHMPLCTVKKRIILLFLKSINNYKLRQHCESTILQLKKKEKILLLFWKRLLSHWGSLLFHS